jgi:hypothetical protein
MQNYSLSQQDQRIISQRTRASKWWTDEELVNISPMHEYHFSLNGKYINTHFALNEEQVELLTYTTLYLAPRPNYTWRGENSPLRVRKWERRGLGMLWCVSILTPSIFIYKPGSPRENTPKHPGNALRIQWEMTRGRWGRTASPWGRSTCGVGRSQVGSVCAAFHLGDC